MNSLVRDIETEELEKLLKWEQFVPVVLVLMHLHTKSIQQFDVPTNIGNGFCLSPRPMGATLIYRTVLWWCFWDLLYFTHNFEYSF